MPQHLLVLRHAEAEPHATSDLRRALTATGREQAARIGTWLKESGWSPDRIVSSPAKRALQTAEIVGETLGILHDEILLDDRVYENALPSLRAVLADHASAGTLLLVGHNPGLEAFVTTLTGPVATDDDRILPPGAIAAIELPDGPLEAGEALLLSIVRPTDL